jgi:hypothetical protein
MQQIDLVYRTMLAELAQRSLDATFNTEFPEAGRFHKTNVKDREYWYFENRVDGKDVRRYVGPADDPDIAKRVAAFGAGKDDYRARRKLVSTLIREARLPAPERLTGDLVEAFSKAGLFRLRAVLVGTIAFQCYPALLGIRLPSSPMQTGDIDFAQFHAVSVSVEDSLPPVLEILHSVDPSFRPVPDVSDGRKDTKFINASQYKVEFLTPNTGSDDYASLPASMPALGGASAQPLRFLDFLIHEPVRTVMLHKAGIPVLIPSAERFAVHKLIVASRRRDDLQGRMKREKDLRQVEVLASALQTVRQTDDLISAFEEAWNRGRHWREALKNGLSMIAPDIRKLFQRALPLRNKEPAD